MDDIGKYLADMDRREFWGLVRKHRPWLTRREAAAMLGRSARCLESWAAQGKGPYSVIKRRFVCYHIDVIEAFMANTD